MLVGHPAEPARLAQCLALKPISIEEHAMDVAQVPQVLCPVWLDANNHFLD